MTELLDPPLLNHTHAASGKAHESEPSGFGMRLECDQGRTRLALVEHGLLDVFKEADLRTGFTDAFATAASREATDRDEVRRRLLFCLYGLGTNAGLKRFAVGRHGFSYKELLHTHRRYAALDY